MDTPTLPVLSLQQLLHINTDIKTNNNGEEDEEILLDLTNLNINDINLELRQLKDELKLDHQAILQSLKNSRLILQRKAYAEKLSTLNKEIQDMKLIKENLEKDKQQQKQILKEKLVNTEQTLNEINQEIELLKTETVSSNLSNEMNQCKDALNQQEQQTINLQKKLVFLEQELETTKLNNSNNFNDLLLTSLQDQLLLDVLNIEINKQQTGCFVGETTFIGLNKGIDNDIKFTDEIKEKAWEALKEDYEKLNII